MQHWDSGKSIKQQPSATIEVKCERCNRHGRYVAYRLYAAFGDLAGPAVLKAIAARGGCERAINPPSVHDISYNDNSCQIRLVLHPPV